MNKLYTEQEALDNYGKQPVFEDMKALYYAFIEAEKPDTRRLQAFDCIGMMTLAYSAGLMQGKRELRRRAG